MRTIVGCVLAIGMLTPGVAHACKCALMPRDKVIQTMSHVFEGHVLRVREDGGTRYATIEMVRPVKGAIPSVVEIATSASTASCGYPFQKGQRLTVGATFREQQFFAHSCTMHSLNQKAR